jgi:acetyl esterase/lipase
MGFSAGGHLSSMAATLFDYGLEEGDEIDRVSCRPNAAVLCYAVTTMNLDFGDEISRGVFVGGLENEDELEKLYSVHLNVRDDTPPMFIWHTAADPIVPVENALQMSTALSAKKIPFELHVFPDGCHGLACCNKTTGIYDFFQSPYCEGWMDMSAKFLERSGLKL